MNTEDRTKITAIRKVLAHMLDPDVRVTSVLRPDELDAMRSEFGDLLDRHERYHRPMTPRVPPLADVAVEVVDKHERQE